MSKKVKALPADKVPIITAAIQRVIDYNHTAVEPWQAVGYTKEALKTIIKQLNGEFPIL